MRRRRIWSLAALALYLGCNDKEDDGRGAPPPPPASQVEFLDNFNEGFPANNWTVIEGFPFAADNRGDEPPGLVMGMTHRSSISGDFTFSTVESVEFSFAFATPGIKTEEETRFTLFILQDDEPGGTASFEVRLDKGVVQFNILGAGQEFDLFNDGAFRTITFSVDQGVARWSIDGQPFIERGEFPEGRYRVQVEADAVTTLGFVIDNVTVSRP